MASELVAGAEGLPGLDLVNLSASAILVIVFFMVMSGKLATPGHQKVLQDRITNLTERTAYLETVVKDQSETIHLQAKNAETLEQIGAVVQHTMGAISDRSREGGST